MGGICGIMTGCRWWWQNYGWFWVVVAKLWLLVGGRGLSWQNVRWLWMVVRFSNTYKISLNAAKQKLYYLN